MLIMIDDECIFEYFFDEEKVCIEKCMVCFCIFGCYLFIGVVEFSVIMLLEIIQEMFLMCIFECQGWVIDYDQVGLMEEKKCQGYF